MRLALREIRRSKVRFILLTAAIGLLVFLAFFMQTLLVNLLGFFTGALEHQSATVLVYGEDARRSLEGSAVTPAQVDAVRAVDGVGEAGPLGERSFTVVADGQEVDAILFGHDLGGPGSPTRLAAGRLPQRDGEGVGSSIDADQGFGVGDTVEIVPGGDAPQAPLPIRIVGTADESRFSVLPTIFVSYDTYERAARVANPSAGTVLPSAVAVIPARGVTPAALAERINREVPGVDALTRDDAVADAPGVSSVSQSFSLIIGLTYIVITIVIGFFFVILTVQKAASLTLLRAIGADTRTLVGALFVQVLLVVVLAMAIGAGILLLAALGSSPVFPIEADPALIGRVGVTILVLALLAALVAARRIARIDPVDAVNRPTLGGLS
ncbi:MAG: FtsX-like permease family protein [Actinomycetes bacterium]